MRFASIWVDLAKRREDTLPADIVREQSQRVFDEVAAIEGLDEADGEIARSVLATVLWPRGVNDSHVDRLRARGLSDREVHDVVEVIACFSFMNALADGLGVTIEARKDEFAEAIYGADGLAHHLKWGSR